MSVGVFPQHILLVDTEADRQAWPDGTWVFCQDSQKMYERVSAAWVHRLTGSYAIESDAAKLLGRGDSGSGAIEEISLGSNLSMSGTTLSVGTDSRFLTTTEQQGALWGGPQGPIGSSVNVATTSDTAYWIYVGRVTTAFTPAYANFSVGSAGSGAQTAEIGFFSTPASPNGANQTVTKIVATGSISSLTSTGVKRNSSAFTTEIAAGTYLWIGIRTAMASTQPGCNYSSRDWARGTLLTTTTAGALTNSGPWTGAVIAWSSSSNEAPVAWWSMQ